MLLLLRQMFRLLFRIFFFVFFNFFVVRHHLYDGRISLCLITSVCHLHNEFHASEKFRPGKIYVEIMQGRTVRWPSFFVFRPFRSSWNRVILLIVLLIIYMCKISSKSDRGTLDPFSVFFFSKNLVRSKKFPKKKTLAISWHGPGALYAEKSKIQWVKINGNLSLHVCTLILGVL